MQGRWQHDIGRREIPHTQNVVPGLVTFETRVPHFHDESSGRFEFVPEAAVVKQPGVVVSLSHNASAFVSNGDQRVIVFAETTAHDFERDGLARLHLDPVPVN